MTFVRHLLGQHVHKAYLTRFVPCDQIARAALREHETLRTAAEARHFVHARLQRQHGDAAKGEEEQDPRWDADEADGYDGGVGKRCSSKGGVEANGSQD